MFFMHLISDGPSIPEIERNGDLIIACREGNLEGIRNALISGANINCRYGLVERWQTPLCVALGNGYFDAAELLLHSGASPDHLDRSGNAALHLMAKEGREEEIAFLIDKGATVDILNTNQRTPLIEAAANGHVDCLKRLLSAGANIFQEDKGGLTALAHGTPAARDFLNAYLDRKALYAPLSRDDIDQEESGGMQL